MQYERKFGSNNVPIFVKIFMGLWVIFFGYNLIDLYQHDSIFNPIVLIFFGFTTFIFTIIILGIKRVNVFMYGDFFKLRRLIGSRDVYYGNIDRIEYVTTHSRNNGRSYYYEFYDVNDKRLLRMASMNLGGLKDQREFLNMLQTYNQHIDFSPEAQERAGGTIQRVGNDGQTINIGDIDELIDLKDEVVASVKNSKLFKILTIGFTVIGILFIGVPIIITLVVILMQ